MLYFWKENEAMGWWHAVRIHKSERDDSTVSEELNAFLLKICLRLIPYGFVIAAPPNLGHRVSMWPRTSQLLYGFNKSFQDKYIVQVGPSKLFFSYWRWRGDVSLVPLTASYKDKSPRAAVWHGRKNPGKGSQHIKTEARWRDKRQEGRQLKLRGYHSTWIQITLWPVYLWLPCTE